MNRAAANFKAPSPAQFQPPTAWRGLRLQRKCACGGTAGAGGECKNCRKRRMAGQPSALQRKAKLAVATSGNPFEREADRAAEAAVAGKPMVGLSNLAAGDTDFAPPIVHEVLQSGGQSLDAPTRRSMSERFRYDFGNVRLHTDGRASASADAVAANAYTVANHVVFAAGRYAPGTRQGQTLLAHELAHVVQQSSGAGLALQRQDKQPTERIDVSIVLGEEETAMIEGRSYATTAIRAISCEDARKKLLALGKPLGRIYIVSHSNQAGQVQVDSPGGKIMVKLSDCSKDLKGLPADIAPTDIDFRGCKLGEAPEQMETFRKNIGAKVARAGNCWSIVKAMSPLTVSGMPLTEESQIPKGQEAEVDKALKEKINSLKSDDGRSVKDCLIGLARGETADGSFAKIRKRYFAHKGNLSAGWASPELNYNWQKGSICVKDMTATTDPCKIVTVSEPAAEGGGAEKKSGALEPTPSDTRYAGDAVSEREGQRVA